MLKGAYVLLIGLYSIVVFSVSLACIYDYNDVDGYYSDLSKERFYNKYNMLQKLQRVDSEVFDILTKNIHSIAGPFEIADVKGPTGTYEAPAWDYSEQGNDWYKNYPKCSGKMQSPVNIITEKTFGVYVPSLQFKDYNSIHPNMSIINNGHTVDVTGPWGETGVDQPTLSGGPLTGTYRLNGVHWHWGYEDEIGSEHSFNDNKRSLEMHFVHYNDKYANSSVAVNSGDPEAVAVVAITFMLEENNSHEIVEAMSQTMRNAFDGKLLFPAAFPLHIINYPTKFYSYIGSLTTPPCNEIVRWIIYEKPLPISSNNLSVFRQFKVGGINIEGNYRKRQPLIQRSVYYEYSN